MFRKINKGCLGRSINSTLKWSKSCVNVESTSALYHYQRQDWIWLYSQNQNCLEYLKELVALRQTKPFAPPIPIEDTDLFYAVISSCDPEPTSKLHLNDGHADVDFIVATSTCEYDLHSNWVMSVPQHPMDESKLKKPAPTSDRSSSTAKKNSDNEQPTTPTEEPHPPAQSG
ncbi:LOW QUALITY PROTEIN: uncharacterized protein C13orf42 [Salvelinus alpinus]